ncbi:MAG TPA: diaminopimelate epimerase [Desulfobacteria bacterium]|nr:diaminopimelate epimerase [Desulfobacteria bacterium]
MKFTKMHGLGNDFVFLDYFKTDLPAVDIAQLAIKLCDRNFGVGGDGLILVLPSTKADARMRIFNSDGSEPEMCGNGVRCFAKYVYEHGIVSHNPLTVETLRGVLSLHLQVNSGIVETVRVDMGEPILKPELVPTTGRGETVLNHPLTVDDEQVKVTAVSMGNPHCITFVDNAAAVPLEVIGPKLEKNSFFPRYTNVEFVQVVNENEVIMRVWERGAGPTLACGTGACATAVACVLNGKTGRKVNVRLPGGDLLVEWEADNHVYMTGPAMEVFNGELK